LCYKRDRVRAFKVYAGLGALPDYVKKYDAFSFEINPYSAAMASTIITHVEETTDRDGRGLDMTYSKKGVGNSMFFSYVPVGCYRYHYDAYCTAMPMHRGLDEFKGGFNLLATRRQTFSFLSNNTPAILNVDVLYTPELPLKRTVIYENTEVGIMMDSDQLYDLELPCAFVTRNAILRQIQRWMFPTHQVHTWSRVRPNVECWAAYPDRTGLVRLPPPNGLQLYSKRVLEDPIFYAKGLVIPRYTHATSMSYRSASGQRLFEPIERGNFYMTRNREGTRYVIVYCRDENGTVQAGSFNGFVPGVPTFSDLTHSMVHDSLMPGCAESVGYLAYYSAMSSMETSRNWDLVRDRIITFSMDSLLGSGHKFMDIEGEVQM